MSKSKIKSGDIVKIISGDDKGKSGKVLMSIHDLSLIHISEPTRPY